ncbi:hypothetical protein L208DRAFT_1375398 [Tricholoma matsutake]|nr:hypothetical protein L208DRAFT_1375398 [Tricholoma matsutake 945]
MQFLGLLDKRANFCRSWDPEIAKKFSTVCFKTPKDLEEDQGFSQSRTTTHRLWMDYNNIVMQRDLLRCHMVQLEPILSLGLGVFYRPGPVDHWWTWLVVAAMVEAAMGQMLMEVSFGGLEGAEEGQPHIHDLSWSVHRHMWRWLHNGHEKMEDVNNWILWCL